MVQRSYGDDTFCSKMCPFWATPGGASGSKWKNISIENLKMIKKAFGKFLIKNKMPIGKANLKGKFSNYGLARIRNSIVSPNSTVSHFSQTLLRGRSESSPRICTTSPLLDRLSGTGGTTSRAVTISNSLFIVTL